VTQRPIDEYYAALTAANTPAEVLLLHRQVLSESFSHEDFAAIHLKMAAKYVQLKAELTPPT
jgi:hypothetical protein